MVTALSLFCSLDIIIPCRLRTLGARVPRNELSQTALVPELPGGDVPTLVMVKDLASPKGEGVRWLHHKRGLLLRR